MLHTELPLVIKKQRKPFGERDIHPHNWWINRNTPVGEDADVYERKPHNGYRRIPWRDILGNRAADGTIVNVPR